MKMDGCVTGSRKRPTFYSVWVSNISLIWLSVDWNVPWWPHRWVLLLLLLHLFRLIAEILEIPLNGISWSVGPLFSRISGPKGRNSALESHRWDLVSLTGQNEFPVWTIFSCRWNVTNGTLWRDEVRARVRCTDVSTASPYLLELTSVSSWLNSSPVVKWTKWSRNSSFSTFN